MRTTNKISYKNHLQRNLTIYADDANGLSICLLSNSPSPSSRRDNMLFLLAAAALQPFMALAAPSATEPLSVPISHITKRDLTGHEQHPDFPLYQRWLQSPVGSKMKRDTDAFLKEHPNLDSIECRRHIDNCLLVSRASLPPRFASAVAEPIVEKRWWENAHNLFISTHLKTYEGNDEDVNPPMGHEHYLDANIRVCNSTFCSRS